MQKKSVCNYLDPSHFYRLSKSNYVFELKSDLSPKWHGKWCVYGKFKSGILLQRLCHSNLNAISSLCWKFGVHSSIRTISINFLKNMIKIQGFTAILTFLQCSYNYFGIIFTINYHFEYSLFLFQAFIWYKNHLLRIWAISYQYFKFYTTENMFD